MAEAQVADPVAAEPKAAKGWKKGAGKWQGGGKGQGAGKKLTPVENLANIATSAQAIANLANTMLRNGGSKVGLADWSLMLRVAT